MKCAQHNSRFVMKVVTFFPFFEDVCLALIDHCPRSIRRLSSKLGAAAAAPSKCAGPLSSLRRKLFILCQRRLQHHCCTSGRKQVRSPTGARVTAEYSRQLNACVPWFFAWKGDWVTSLRSFFHFRQTEVISKSEVVIGGTLGVQF